MGVNGVNVYLSLLSSAHCCSRSPSPNDRAAPIYFFIFIFFNPCKTCPVDLPADVTLGERTIVVVLGKNSRCKGLPKHTWEPDIFLLSAVRMGSSSLPVLGMDWEDVFLRACHHFPLGWSGLRASLLDAHATQYSLQIIPTRTGYLGPQQPCTRGISCLLQTASASSTLKTIQGDGTTCSPPPTFQF